MARLRITGSSTQLQELLLTYTLAASLSLDSAADSESDTSSEASQTEVPRFPVGLQAGRAQSGVRDFPGQAVGLGGTNPSECKYGSDHAQCGLSLQRLSPNFSVVCRIRLICGQFARGCVGMRSKQYWHTAWKLLSGGQIFLSMFATAAEHLSSSTSDEIQFTVWAAGNASGSC